VCLPFLILKVRLPAIMFVKSAFYLSRAHIHTQTEEEKARGLPVVFPDFDRQTCNIPVTQVKFIDYFISGLFEAWNNYCPIPVMVEHLNANYDDWKSQYNSPSSSEEEAEAEASNSS